MFLDLKYSIDIYIICMNKLVKYVAIIYYTLLIYDDGTVEKRIVIE